jgi:hypothetical protein
MYQPETKLSTSLKSPSWRHVNSYVVNTPTCFHACESSSRNLIFYSQKSENLKCYRINSIISINRLKCLYRWSLQIIDKLQSKKSLKLYQLLQSQSVNNIHMMHFNNRYNSGCFTDYMLSIVYNNHWYKFLTYRFSSFGGLGVNALASGTQVRGFKPGRSCRIFKGGKILSTPSFGREVKAWVPCRRFAAHKRSLNVSCKSAFRQNFAPISSNFLR